MSAVIVYCFLSPASGWKSLLQRIPNADYVTNPCDPAQPWEGIGHENPAGYGARNQFGIDFKKHGMAWNPSICATDSDGDGRTNGEELGDKDCTWSPINNVTLATAGVTHPGICEPLGSDICKNRNYWLNCAPDFKCDVINESDTRNMTVRFPKLAVPVKATTHYCMIFQFPQDGDFHMVATQPLLDNKKVMHHILFFGCAEDQQPAHEVGVPYECELNFDRACREQLSVWLLGTQGQCVHEHAGFRIGQRGYKLGGIQVHWENVHLLPTETDSSGMTFFYTERLRENDAGILFVGQNYLTIPPSLPRFTEMGKCHSECTRRKFSEAINVTYALNHMHYLGREMSVRVYRSDQLVSKLTDEHDYQFDTPHLYSYNEPVRIQPGDEIRITCVYDSMSRDNITHAGSGYQDEMCFGFLTYYPKQAISEGSSSCVSWKDIPLCLMELENNVMGCNFKNIHNLSNPVTRSIYDSVTSQCQPFGPCQPKCLPVVQDLLQQPCYIGDMWDWSRDKILKRDVNDNSTADWLKFYASVDSCTNQASLSSSQRFQS
ncbi:DOPO-like protein, partial [Mya arenaria]